MVSSYNGTCKLWHVHYLKVQRKETMKEPGVTLASKLLKGAAILSLAAILTKLLGTLQKIPLQNIGGDGVFGIYNTVYPFIRCSLR